MYAWYFVNLNHDSNIIKLIPKIGSQYTKYLVITKEFLEYLLPLHLPFKRGNLYIVSKS